MSITGFLVGAGVVFYLNKDTFKKGKKTNKEDNSFEVKVSIPSKVETKPEVLKNDSEKNLIDILEEITDSDEMENFTLIEKNESSVKYQYLKNNILITVTTDEDYIKCNIQENGDSIIEYTFDRYECEFDRKKVVRSLLERFGKDDIYETLEVFEDKIFDEVDWDEILEDGYQVIDDVKSIHPRVSDKPMVSLKKEEPKKESIIQELLLNEKVDTEIKYIASGIEQKVKEVKKELNDLKIDEIHTVEELIQNDLTGLLKSYIKLQGASKEEYKEKIKVALNKIDNQINQLYAQIEIRDKKEIDRMLNIIEQRYIG